MNGIVFAVVVLVTSIVLVAVLAWVSRRLLGLPVGALRAAIAGLVGFVAALIVGQALRATESGHLVAFFSVALGVPLIVAMIFIVAAEALVPTGAGPQPVEIVLARTALARALAALRADQPDPGAARAGSLPAGAAAARLGDG